MPGEINGKPITIIGAYAFAYNQSIKSSYTAGYGDKVTKRCICGVHFFGILKLNLDGLKSAGKRSSQLV